MSPRRWHFLATLAALTPALSWWALEMGKSSDSRIGLFAFPLGVALIWRDRGGGDEPARPGLVVMSLALYLGLWCLHMRTFAVAAALVAGAVASLGTERGRSLPLAAMMLLLMGLPIFRDLQYVGGYPLRLASGEIAAEILRLQGLSVLRIGTALDWQGELIEIDAPCSGIKMLWTSTLVALVAASWLRLNWWRFGVTLLALPVIVVIANALRCAALFHLESGRLDLPAWAHAATGILIFALAAVAQLGVARRLEARNDSC